MKTGWEDINNVFKHIETSNGRPLTQGEKELIRGQRQINRRFFEAINEILEVLSPDPAASAIDHSEALTRIKKAFKSVPGERPPGCASDAEGPAS